MKTAS